MKADDFEEYLDYLAHVDRVSGLKDYCTGLMLPLERKSVEPLAAHLDPLHVSAKHQALLHFVGQSEWSDALLDRVLAWIQPEMERGESEWFWTTPARRRRACIRAGWRGSTAGNLASRTVAR